MNPYLEQDDAWHYFHERFCTRLADELVSRTGSNYLVKLDENVYLHELPSEQRRLVGRPDVMVVEPGGRTQAGAATAWPTASVAPAYANLPAVDLERLSYVEIRDARSRRLITAIELLSPTNKRPGSDRDQYLAKRATLMRQGVNLVEIDLLRGGPRMPMDPAPACDYLVMVARPPEWPRAGFWPIRLRDPLPEVPVPLAPPDADAQIALQPLIHAVYDSAGYNRFVYDGEPDPPLRGDDGAWAQQVLSRTGNSM
jgi:hypothetical protein